MYLVAGEKNPDLPGIYIILSGHIAIFHDFKES